MKKGMKYLTLLLLFSMLVLIRAFEDRLFYDPFVLYFQNDYLYAAMPQFQVGKLFLHLLFRYALNSLISLAILYVFFKKMGYVILSAKLYVLAFILLAPLYYYLLATGFEKGYLFPFYIRRFLIHPVFLLLLLVAWYYEERLETT